MEERLAVKVARFFQNQKYVILRDRTGKKLNSPEEAEDRFAIWLKIEGVGSRLAGVLVIRGREVFGRFFGITGDLNELAVIFGRDFAVACDFALSKNMEDLLNYLV